jgi:hypothetical protein
MDRAAAVGKLLRVSYPVPYFIYSFSRLVYTTYDDDVMHEIPTYLVYKPTLLP